MQACMNALENYISSHNTTYFMNGMSLILVSKTKGNQLTTTSLALESLRCLVNLEP